MKHTYIGLQALLLLIFGLISCSPDNKQGPKQDLIAKIGVEIQNLDNTMQRIKDTKKVRASSSISLLFKNQATPPQNINSKVTCKTSFRQELLTRDTSIKNQSNIIIKNILPSEVFTPSDEEGRSVVCDFNLKVHFSDFSEVQITLDDVFVSETDTFVNLELDFIASDDKSYFLKDQLAAKKLDTPEEATEVRILCSQSSFKSFLNNDDVTYSELLDPSLFSESNIEKCRVYLHDEKSKKTWLSKSFYIQNESATLSYRYEYSFSTSLDWSAINKAMTLVIKNNSDVTSYLRINTINPGTKLRPIYSDQALNIGAYYIEGFGTSGKWTLQGGILEKNNNDPTLKIYKLRPGQSMEVDLSLSSTHRCASSKLVDTWGSPLCNSPVFAGYNYTMSRVPIIYKSKYDDYTMDQWQRITAIPDRAQHNLEAYNIWVPNQQIHNICSGYSVIADPVNNVQRLTGLGGIPHHCHH